MPDKMNLFEGESLSNASSSERVASIESQEHLRNKFIEGSRPGRSVLGIVESDNSNSFLRRSGFILEDVKAVRGKSGELTQEEVVEAGLSSYALGLQMALEINKNEGRMTPQEIRAVGRQGQEQLIGSLQASYKMGETFAVGTTENQEELREKIKQTVAVTSKGKANIPEDHLDEWARTQFKNAHGRIRQWRV